MRIGPPVREAKGEQVRLAAAVTWRGREEELWFAWTGAEPGAVDDTADPFVVACLVPAMAAGEEVLEVAAPVSSRLLDALPRVQEILLRWHRDFRPVEVRAEVRPGTGAGRRDRGATFFSLGVDSFYTALRHGRPDGRRPAIDTLLFTRGLERPLESTHDGPEAEQAVRTVAAALGLELLVGATNLRTLFSLDWATVLHGPGLAATALTLAPRFGTVLISGGHAWEQVKPWGSSWLTEERYSTERQEVRIEGGDATRAEKIAWIADHDLARRHLRVCTANLAGPGNCGCCPKCVRTMLALALLGRLADTPAFPPTLPADLEAYLHADIPLYAAEVRDFAVARGTDPALVARVVRAFEDRDRRQHLRGWLEASAMAPFLPVVRLFRRFLREG